MKIEPVYQIFEEGEVGVVAQCLLCEYVLDVPFRERNTIAVFDEAQCGIREHCRTAHGHSGTWKQLVLTYG